MAEVEPPRWASDGPTLFGDYVSLRWDWVCDRLSRGQLFKLRRYSMLDPMLARTSA